jgi:outer membrane immunogenic protein
VATPGTLTAPLGGYTGTVAVTNFLGGRNNNMEGFAGGGHIGYNYQIGNIVVGIEADASYTDFGNNSQNNNNLSVVTLVPGVCRLQRRRELGIASGGLDYYGTVRGRLGYAMDRLLVFGTVVSLTARAPRLTTSSSDRERPGVQLRSS